MNPARLWGMALAAGLLMSSSPALACAVCGGGGPNRQAFIDTMIFMSAGPLVMLSGLLGFIVYRVRSMPDEAPIPSPQSATESPSRS